MPEWPLNGRPCLAKQGTESFHPFLSSWRYTRQLPASLLPPVLRSASWTKGTGSWHIENHRTKCRGCAVALGVQCKVEGKRSLEQVSPFLSAHVFTEDGEYTCKLTERAECTAGLSLARRDAFLLFCFSEGIRSWSRTLPQDRDG